MTEKRFDEKAVAALLGDCRLEDAPLYRWDMKGEVPGIYLGDIEEIERHFLPSEIMEMTGGLASRSRDSRFPLLAFPCTLAEFVAFEDRACVFRAHLEAGDETADLLREIAAENPDAGILACALMPGELPDDEEKLILLPLEQPAPAVPPVAESAPAVVGDTRTEAPQPEPVVQAEEIDLSMLADPGQLIDAFGRYTNMDASWFDKWKDYPALNNAIKRKGTSGRGRTTEPLFCPFLVMLGLMKKPRSGSKRKAFEVEGTPWRMLKQHFPRVYNMHKGLSPLDD